MRLITEVCVERGLAAIINIHDVALAQLFAKRIIGLRLGEIVYDGTPDHGRLRSAGRLSYPGFLVSILVPGLLAGIIAIALRSIGFIGKLLYEAIEEIDSSQVEAVAAPVPQRHKSSIMGSPRKFFRPLPGLQSFAGISIPSPGHRSA